MADAVPVLLAVDHALVRRVRLILEGEPDLEVVAEAGDGAGAVAPVRDRTVPLVLTPYDDEQYFFPALEAGACGYVLTSVGADRDLVTACRTAVRNEPFLRPGAVTALMRTCLGRRRRGEDVPDHLLTAREEEVRTRITEGDSSEEIAATLCSSVRTVRRHRAHLLHKRGARDRPELTRCAVGAGLAGPPPSYGTSCGGAGAKDTRARTRSGTEAP